MSEETKKLLDELREALRDAVSDSQRVRGILKRIEEKDHITNLSLTVILGLKDQPAEIQQIIYGSKRSERTSSVRRLSAYDRRFLKALRITIAD